VPEVVIELQSELRSEFKEPLGPIYTDTEELLAVAGTPLVTVGDVVTYHILEAGRTPEVALADERTKREAVDDEIADAVFGYDGFDRTVSVTNPPGTLTAELVSALVTAIESAGSTLIVVDGEEDLAGLPAILAAPDGASIVYGQPNEGMVHVEAASGIKGEMRELLGRMEGDSERLWALLGVSE